MLPGSGRFPRVIKSTIADPLTTSRRQASEPNRVNKGVGGGPHGPPTTAGGDQRLEGAALQSVLQAIRREP